MFRQLAAQGMVVPDLAGHGGLALGPSAGEVLRGDVHRFISGSSPSVNGATASAVPATRQRRRPPAALDPAAQAMG